MRRLKLNVFIRACDISLSLNNANMMTLSKELMDRLTQPITESFLCGFVRLFVPPEQMTEEWLKRDPMSYFSSDEEESEFLEFLKDVVDNCESESECDNDGDDETAVTDARVSQYVDLAGRKFAHHVLTQTLPLIWNTGGHPPFWKSDNETKEVKEKRVYDLVHDIVYDYFLALYSELDTEEAASVIKSVNETELARGNEERFETILDNLRADNEYAAKAVKAATDACCGVLFNPLIELAPEIQSNIKQSLAVKLHVLQCTGQFV